MTPLFSEAIEVAGNRPNTLISDGAENFHSAITSSYGANRLPRTRYINHIKLQGNHNNNKMDL